MKHLDSEWTEETIHYLIISLSKKTFPLYHINVKFAEKPQCLMGDHFPRLILVITSPATSVSGLNRSNLNINIELLEDTLKPGPNQHELLIFSHVNVT